MTRLPSRFRRPCCGLLAACLISITTASACGGDDDTTPVPNGTSGRGGSGGRRAAGAGGAGVGAGGENAGGEGASGAGGAAAQGGGRAGAGGTTGRAGNNATAGRGGVAAGGGGVDGEGDAGVDVPPIESKAADLRVVFAMLFSEHIMLTAKATSASLDGRSGDFNAYYDQVRDNGVRIGDYIGLFEGQASAMFASLWGSQDQAFVNYTRALAADNTEQQAAALSVLRDEFVPQFAAFLHGTSELSEELIRQLTSAQVETIKSLIDTQKTGDWTRIVELQHNAYVGIQTFADALSSALSDRVPHVFPGDPTGKDVEFRVSTNLLLQEHSYLLTWTAAAERGERETEASAVRTALGDNRASLAAVFETYYNSQAVERFNGIWNAHNNALIDYATADGPDRESAATILSNSFVPMFADLLHDTAGLGIADVRALATEHITRAKAVIDFQVGEDSDQAAVADIAAAQYMQQIGDPLSKAIVVQQPDRF